MCHNTLILVFWCTHEPQPKNGKRSVSFKEKYKRPCFAASTDGSHGIIILKDGSRSGPIRSIEGGKEILKTFTTLKEVSPEDADRIEDHLACSDLPNVEPPSPSSLLTSLAIAVFGGLFGFGSHDETDTHKHKCPKCGKVWEHGSDCRGNEQAHECPKCGTIQWASL